MATPATTDLCDAHGDDPGVRVLPPVFASYGGVAAFCGEVATVRCFEDNSKVRDAVAEPGRGRVLVVDGGASLRRALLGGKLARTAAANGWAGVVVDGCVRDAAELAACAVGVRALALHPQATVKRGVGESGVAVQIQGVTVRPGEWLCADADGIVVAPRPLAI